MPTWIAVGIATAALIGTFTFAYAALIERNWFRVRSASLKVLPAGSKAIRVLHISDLHLRKNQGRKQRWLSQLHELRPDLIVNTGDNLGGLGSVSALEASLSSLSQVPGVFVNGSNDYEAPVFRNPLGYLRAPSKPSSSNSLETSELVSALERLGWHNLNNRSADLKVGTQRLELLGVDDPHIAKADFDALKSQKTAGTNRRTGSETAIRIGVAHAPYASVLREFTNLGADLVFAGHTHGGQVCLPGGRALVTNCDLPPRFARGLSAWQFGDRRIVLHVCAGLGTSVLAPFRLFCPPEVALVELLPVS